jgi:hypothetical protein
MVISTYELLPPSEQAALPSAQELTTAFDQPVNFHGRKVTLAEGMAMLDSTDRGGPDQP